ncbi:hypothetical protein RFY89_13155, partial [Acinetobacter baumannii]|nr:hypothetical protein [Acinetobacter baumannii]
EAIRFLNQEYGIDEATAYAYLSAATDFEVSQVVDKTKGIHAKIRLQLGLEKSRELYLQIIEKGLPIASEILSP